MKNIFLLILLSALALAGCNRKSAKKNSKTTTSSKPAKVQKGVQFDKSTPYASIVKQAKAENKPILIDFYTTWCAPCKWMDKDVFELDAVADLLNKNFINMKVDAERGQGPTLAEKFGVGGFPTLVYLSSEGDVLHKQLGMTSATNVMSQAKQVMKDNSKE